MESNSKKILRNSIVALVCQIILVFVSFFHRSVFIKFLGLEYLGVNGLFSNILIMLSLSEMGFGTAITHSLYKAVKEDDTDKINRLMSFYSKIYTIIGLSILGVGIIASFFIHFLIKDNSFDLTFLRISFLLFVVNNAATYFLSYRACILFVHEKDWLCKITSTIVTIVGTSLQVIFLFVFKNYFLNLSLQILTSISINIALFILAKKYYPLVKINYKDRLKPEESKTIKKGVASLAIHSISGAINFGTDNIIISKFVGIYETGLYSNYSLIFTTLNTLIAQLLNGVIATFGKIAATADRLLIYLNFKKVDFISKAVYGFFAIGTVSIISAFITLWVGENSLLDSKIVLLLIVNFYMLGARQAIIVTRNVCGLFTKDKIVAIIKPIVNLLTSLLFTIKFGLIGVFIGTFLSQLLCDLILSPIFVFRDFFSSAQIKRYYFDYAKNLLVLVFSAVCIIILKRYLILGNLILNLIVSGFIGVIIYTILFCLVYCRTEEFKYFFALAKSMVFKSKRKA